LSQIMELKEKTLSELETKYEDLFPSQKVPSNNKVFLWRKIAYRLQELESGGISVETQSKIKELIQKYDPINNLLLRPNNIRPLTNGVAQLKDRRLPIPGSIITKNYKGKKIEVKVLENGFEYNGNIYKSLSNVACAITGQHWNGYMFFRM
ncbi:MAG: DUF2924 domain-containing protein, partial [Candidatus Omnitrophota bacterium]